MWVDILPNKQRYLNDVLALSEYSNDTRFEDGHGDIRFSLYHDQLIVLDKTHVNSFVWTRNSYDDEHKILFKEICDLYMIRVRDSSLIIQDVIEYEEDVFRPLKFIVNIMTYRKYCEMFDKRIAEVKIWTMCAKRIGVSRDIQKLIGRYILRFVK